MARPNGRGGWEITDEDAAEIAAASWGEPPAADPDATTAATEAIVRFRFGAINLTGEERRWAERLADTAVAAARPVIEAGARDSERQRIRHLAVTEGYVNGTFSINGRKYYYVPAELLDGDTDA